MLQPEDTNDEESTAPPERAERGTLTRLLVDPRLLAEDIASKVPPPILAALLAELTRIVGGRR